MYEISVQHAFTAAHAIALPDGSMEPSHRHTWLVTATFRAARLTEPMGVVVDFVAVQKAMQTIGGKLEATDLNALAEFADAPPSAERLAELIARRLTESLGQALGSPGGRRPWLHGVSLTEAPGCLATFYPHRRSS